MWRGGWLVLVLAAAANAGQGATPPRDMKDLTFLTREGCVNTPDMQVNLDDALIKLGWRRNYQDLDIGKLPKTDARTGYPTPTVLWRGRDIFGLAVPKPPYPTPT
jgi:hypothetical protein